MIQLPELEPLTATARAVSGRLDGLTPGAAALIVDGCCRQVLAHQPLAWQEALFAAVLATSRLGCLGDDFLNDVGEEVLPAFFRRAVSDSAAWVARPPLPVDGWRLLGCLAAYAAEPTSLAGRLRVLGFALQGGALSRLKAGLPDHRVTAASLFSGPISNLGELDWRGCRDTVIARLASFEFVGAQSFELGLRQTWLAALLAIAAAKWRVAAAAAPVTLLPADMAWGQELAMTAMPSGRLLTVFTRQLTDPGVYQRLLYGLLHG